jgi:hypothetical protein
MSIKIVTIATRIIKEHDLIHSGKGYFKTKDDGIITHNYIYKWLKINGFYELCLQVCFFNLIQQITFEIEILH